MLKIAIVTMSDRASAGVYEDKSGKEIEAYLSENVKNEYEIVYKLIPDDFDKIKEKEGEYAKYEGEINALRSILVRYLKRFLFSSKLISLILMKNFIMA